MASLVSDSGTWRDAVLSERLRLGDAFFARFESPNGELYVCQLTAEEYHSPRSHTPDKAAPPGEWRWMSSWAGAVFNTTSGMLDSPGDYYPGDTEIGGVLIDRDGAALALLPREIEEKDGVQTIAPTAEYRKLVVGR